jgi:hypothetical protein
MAYHVMLSWDRMDGLTAIGRLGPILRNILVEAETGSLDTGSASLFDSNIIHPAALPPPIAMLQLVDRMPDHMLLKIPPRRLS